MSVVFHVAAYCFAVVGIFATYEYGLRARRRHRKRSYDAMMARVAALEISTGLGLDVARDWLEQQPKRVRDPQLVMSGQWYCFGCRKWYEANGRGFHKLCGSCRSASPRLTEKGPRT